jgi:hypothetical protein
MAQKFVVSQNGVTITASTAITLFEFITTANTNLTVVEWSVEFNQFNAAQPVLAQWILSTTAGTTPVAQTPVAWQSGQGTAQGVTVNQSFAAENFTASSIYDQHTIPITSGLFVQYPYGREITFPVSTASARLRVTPGTTGGTATVHVVVEV